uniref:Uncharacterized protein n=1 Tax=Rhinolophus ferrumequinum TaxID=59479 RepID=A0A671F5P1_RHIFE
MNNHQLKLAKQLNRRASLLLYLQHVSWAVTVRGLNNTEMFSSWPARTFSAFLDKVVGSQK